MKTIVIAKVLVLDGGDSALILRRSGTHPTMAFKRDLPGGEIEHGEDIAEGVRRELQEEAGLSAQLADLRLLYAATEVWHNQNRVRLFYVVKLAVKQPEVTLSWEHDRFEWVPREQLVEVEKDYHDHPFYGQALAYIREHELLDQ